jgi:hypothetical protein
VDVAPVLPTEAPGNHVGVRAYAIDPKAAAQLWGLSEALTGLRFEA